MGQEDIKTVEKDLKVIEDAETSIERTSVLHKELLEELQCLV